MSARPITLLVCDDRSCAVTYAADTPRVREARSEAAARAGWTCVRLERAWVDLCPRHAVVRRDALEREAA